MIGYNCRFWHKIEKRFVEARNINFDNDTIGYDAEGEFNYTESSPISDFIIQRGSGKLDINGKEVYEGDIVEFVFAQQTDLDTGEKQGPSESFGIYEIFYKDAYAAFCIRAHKKNWLDGHFKLKDDRPWSRLYPELTPVIINELPLSDFRIESVIGNILENPDFLNIKEPHYN